AGIKIVAIGPSTAKTLRKYGLNADIIPKKYISEGLVDELKTIISRKDRILIPRAKSARNYLVDELSTLAKVEEVKTYETLRSSEDNQYMIDSLKEMDSYYLLFSSPTTFINFKKIAGENAKDILRKGKIISIGPVTSRTIEEKGYSIYKES